MDDKDIQFRKICLYLEEKDKSRRKVGLESIDNMLSQTENYKKEDLIEIWNVFHKPVVRILNDKIEICRELAVGILKKFILTLPVQEQNVAYIIPILTRRLSSQELLETSEEIRLYCVSFIIIIMNKYENHLNPYFEDLVAILAKTVTDNYPKVKIESCRAISELAKLSPHCFYTHSESFVKGILSNFTHPHHKVRQASIFTIGDVLQYGKSIIMQEISTPMAQRLFDLNGSVRAAVIEVAGNWLINLKDKYSWWYKLIPLISTGLHDEISEIRKRSAELWNATGLKYLEENESDEKIKDRMDFLEENPEHYPPNLQRPNLGCRIIVQQNLGKLVNGIVVELDYWLVDVRIRSAQLLCVLVFHAEQDVTMNIEKLLPAMYRACNDEDSRVVENIELAALYMGYFIPPSTYCPLVLLSLEENPTSGHLRVFASILSGSERSKLEPELEKIADFIEQNFHHSSSVKYKTEVLSCCNSLISVCKDDCKIISSQLFKAIFSIMASTNVLEKKSNELLSELVIIEGFSNLSELYSKHVRNVLNEIQNSCESWNINTLAFKVFQACISECWHTIVSNADLVLTILEKTTNSNADAEVRLKQYILLSQYLVNNEQIFYKQPVEKISLFVNAILDKVISPGLIWSAGRTAEALRTASVCCLCALLKKLLNNSLQENDKIHDLSFVINGFNDFFEKTIPILVSLIDDDAIKTRYYSLSAIYSIIILGKQMNSVNFEHIHKIYPVLLKRLDDGSDDVRCGAIELLQEIWKDLPEDYNLEFYNAHIDMVYTTAIIHMDDPETKFQDLMLNARKCIGKVQPRLLIQKNEKCRSNFRNQKGLDCLLESIKESLKIKKKEK